MKRILLTYGYHKSGHYSAVRAIEEELESRGISSETCNLWNGKAKTIDALFTIFRAFAAKGVKKVPDFLISYKLLDLFSEELPFNIDLHAYDGIISTHQYSSSVLAAHKSRQQCTTPLIHVHTNYNPFPIRTHPNINFYTGATPKEDAGVDLHQRIVATGIPVRKAFRYDKKPKEKQIVILGGADGFGEIEKIANFAAKIDSRYELHIVCGRNVAAFEELRKRFPSHQVFGYVEDLSEQFSRAEFVITKASGLTIAEALNCECIPIFPPPILSWEDEAARYLCSQGVGVCIPEFDNTSIKIMNALLTSEGYKDALRERGRTIAKPNAAKEIVDLIECSTKEFVPDEQLRMIDEMKSYHDIFSAAQDMPKLADYIKEQIECWLKEHEPNNSN